MNTNAAIYELDPTSGAELNRTCSSLGAYNKFAVVNDVLYAGLTNNTALYQVDLENCTESVIGEAGIRWGPDFNSIYSISGHDGVLYGIGVQVNLPRDYVVVTIDTSTGIATEVSSTDSANSPVENESITGRVLTNIPDDFFIDTSGMSACVTSNAVHQGRMENSSGDFGGDFLSGSLACLVESDDTPATLDKYPGDDARSPANIFSFEMASGRGVDITINPNTQMLTSHCRSVRGADSQRGGWTARSLRGRTAATTKPLRFTTSLWGAISPTTWKCSATVSVGVPNFRST